MEDKRRALIEHIKLKDRYLDILLENIKNLKIRINELKREKTNNKEKLKNLELLKNLEFKLNNLEKEKERGFKNLEYSKELLDRDFNEKEYFKAIKGYY